MPDRASSKGCTIRQTPQKIIPPDGGHGKIIIHGGCCFSGEAGDQGNCNRTCPDRTESQKTSDHQWEAMSTVLKAYENSIGVGIVERPKALGDLRGASYIYPIFYRFGLIEVSEKVKEILRGKKR